MAGVAIIPYEPTIGAKIPLLFWDFSGWQGVITKRSEGNDVVES